MDNNNINVKSEKTSAASVAGGGNKPKFVPKAPVKKDTKPTSDATNR